MNRRRLAIALAAVALGAVAAAIAFFRAGSVIPVDVFVAKEGPIDEIVAAVSAGTVRSRRESTLAAETGGRAVKVLAREGDAVRTGRLLALLSDPEMEGRLDAAEAEVTRASEQLEQARARRDEAASRFASAAARAAANLRKSREDARRARELQAAGFLSKAEMEQAETALANAQEDERLAATGDSVVRALDREIASLKALTDSARASQAALKEKSRKLAVTAPFEGIVIRKTVEVGEVKQPGAPLFVLADPRDIDIEAPIDESEAARVAPGQAVRLLPDAYLGETFRGIVTEVLPTIEASKEVSRANTIRIAPVAPPKPLRLGMSVDVEVLTGGKAGALQVPSAAVMERGGKKFVYVVSGGKIVRKEVTAGISNWERMEILSGLSPGEAVVTSLEAQNLGPGSRVDVRRRQ